MKNLIFPFTAIVGQEDVKKALILNAINPGIGGVLIKGDKGTGKTTSVRALADLLPLISVVKGCSFNCDPNNKDSLCEICQSRDMEIEEQKMRVVELPLGSTEDRVVGSIDIQKALKEGVKALEPGILAEANRNILYVDEINLLDDHLVDVLLDAAAYGVNNVEREGISISHPSEFILVGTMNPAEGELRPQLSDRIGLHIIVHSIHDITHRVAIMQRREQFEKDPESFKKSFEKDQQELLDKIIQARKIIGEIQIDNHSLELIARICVEAGVDGHRADIAILKTSKAIAAYQGRMKVTEDDLKEAITLVLGDRMPGNFYDPDRVQKQIEKAKSDMEKETQEENDSDQGPEDEDNSDKTPQTLDEDSEEEKGDENNQPSENPDNQNQNENSNNDTSQEEVTLEINMQEYDEKEDEDQKESQGKLKGQSLDNDKFRDDEIEADEEEVDIKKLLKMKGKKKERLYGKRVSSKTEKGKYVKSKMASPKPGDIAIDATLRAAALRSRGEIKVESDDLREKIRKHGARASIALVVDISGSMFSERKAHKIKGILNQIMKDADRHKDKISVIGFKGKDAEVIIPTTKRAISFQQKVDQIRVGGTTPMSSGLKKGLAILKNEKKSNEFIPMLVLLTDGMPNVGIDGSPSKEVMEIALELNENEIHTVVVNFEKSVSFGRNFNMEIAMASGGRYYELEELKNPGKVMGKILDYERGLF
nr:VWA domain-containing protein [Methanobacterium alcaliphilum]